MKFLLFIPLLLASCTSAEMSKFASLGKPVDVKCYSGGTLVYEGTSTGKIKSEANSDGYYFTDAKTKELVEISADCVFKEK